MDTRPIDGCEVDLPVVGGGATGLAMCTQMNRLDARLDGRQKEPA